ncbi:MAG TPA: class I SAM-dependent methyltransferase [Acidimicrobiales bacterium]|nr:class I SAM-dependent methyltransferase [Acidimicrobiales bacterium]
MSDPLADRQRLRSAAYVDDTKLAARQAIYRFAERPWPSDGGRVLGAVTLRGDEVVVDVGCGNGNDIRDLQRSGFGGTILGLDLSVGMLATVAPLGVPLANADAATLPLREGAADVALAMHMLYHCPDIAATVAELRRVVRRDGTLVVSTNSRAHFHELRAHWTASLSEASGIAIDPWQSAAERFSLEDAPAVLAASFEDVRLERTDNRLLVPSVEPVVAYVESTRDLSGHDVTDEVWAAAIELLRAQVESVIAEDGALELTVVKGVLVAR